MFTEAFKYKATGRVKCSINFNFISVANGASKSRKYLATCVDAT